MVNNAKWEINWVYQEHWVVKFSWSKHVRVEDGKMKMVCCKIYSQIEVRKKNLEPKLDSLLKHFSLHKCTKAKCGVVIGQFFSCPINQQVKMKSCLHLQVVTQLLFKRPTKRK
jgi:hypothetical protein